jgi:hypothetical protein
MAVSLSLLAGAGWQFFDDNGNPLSGGLLYTYEAGTTTPLATYTDSNGNVANANPIVLDAAGRVPYQVWLDTTADYKFILQTSLGITVWTEDNVAGGVSSAAATFLQAGTGAVTRTAQAKMREIVSVLDFGADPTGVSDSATAIQNAINYAHGLSLGTITVPYDTIRKGGTTVYLPPGAYNIGSTIEIKENVVLQGAGRFSTIITSTYDGTLIRNQTPIYYDAFGMGIKDLCVQGDRTKTNQIGIALLRDWQGTYSNVAVVECGSHGWRLYQCIGSQFHNVESLECVGRGFMVTDGIGSWASPTATNLPSNNLDIYGIHTYGCDGAGIYLGRIGTGIGVMGCQFFGGSSEYNYRSSSAGTGYNVELVDTASAAPNIFYSLWCEDSNVLAHVHINLNDATEPVIFENFKHFGSGAAAWPQKAIIVTQGRLLLNSPVGSGTAYRTYLGSNAPFQVTKATGSIWGGNFYGATMTQAQAQVVDETGATTGLEGNVKINNFGNTWGGEYRFNTDFGQGGPYWFQTGQSFAYAEMSTFYKGIMLGPGTAAADAGLTRVAANVLGRMTGDSFRVGGIANETLAFNAGTANGSVATTLGSVGPTGSTAGNPQGWLRINVNGTDRYVPYW